MQDFIEYKKARAVARRTINDKKKKDFVRFIESINKFTSMSYVWKKIKVLRHPFRTVEWNKWQTKSREKGSYLAINTGD